ncbi:MAG: histidine--tRNA ligase [Elusimicrobiaceae bacterium]|nr:histidine--tRNA ligase [Elusimicrobiaceae bacterium]
MAKLVRGFRDIFEPQSNYFTELENCARGVFALYGFSELRLPTVEQKELFIKSTGETTDIVQKEMYAFEDAGHRQLAIRPEGTPGVVRAYLENNFVQQAPVQKFYYIGNMFRAERPQAGRYREFEQIGAEYIGNSAPAADAEVILMLKDIVAHFGAKNYTVKINSLGCDKCRPLYRQALIDFLSEEKDTLCENCQTRLEKNPLRVLDCKIDGPRFQGRVPTLQLCADCAQHFEEVQRLLTGKINFVVDPMLVRGLDYYSRTVFEFQAGDASQNAIAAGGRYDTLVKNMGGPATPAIGWAMGAERVILSRAETEIRKPKSVYVVSMDTSCNETAFRLMQTLREAGIRTEGGLFDKNLKGQMKQADRCGASYALILGSDELSAQEVTLKDLQTGEQKRIAFTVLSDEVKKLV